MTKISRPVLLIVTAILFLVLTYIFLELWLGMGDVAEQSTLFAILKKVDWLYALIIFIGTAIYMGLLDLLTVFLIKHFRKTKEAGNVWSKYRKIHLVFILLTLFLTIAIALPSTIMNTFTAIVSISVLVSNLTKKLP